MNRLRNIKRKARADLHREMAVGALYFATPNATPVPVTVRVHTKLDLDGALPGFSGAQVVDTNPKLVFLRSEIAAVRNGAVVSVEAGEAYRIVTAQPADGLTITADVTRLSAAEASGLAVPDE